MRQNEQKEINKRLFVSCKETALSSVYWSRRVSGYHIFDVYEYSPMIQNELFNSLFTETDIVGSLAVEEKLGRKLKIEELRVCPLSVNYLIFGEPIVTGTGAECSTLIAFHDLIEGKIKRYERRAIGAEIKYLQKKLDDGEILPTD